MNKKFNMNNPPNLRLGLLLALFLGLFSFSSKAQLAAWQLNGAAGNEASKNATTVAANLSTPALTRGGGVNVTALANAFSGTNFPASGTQTDAETNGRGFSFTFSANLGYKVSLSTLDYRVRRSGTGPNAFVWQYSINGGAYTNIGSPISYTLTNTGGDAMTQINLSGISALQDVLYGNTITLRIVAWGASGTGGTFAIGRSLTAGATDFSLNLGGTVVSAGPIPTITASGALTALSTTYGTPSSTATFDVSGTDMQTGVTVTAPSGFEVSDNNSAGFGSTTTVGTAGNFSLIPVYVRLAQTATVAGSPYSGNIVLSSTGAGSVNVATVSSTVSTLVISASGATAQNKIYDGTTIASITGATPSTTVNGDAISIIGDGSFNDANVGTAKLVNANLSLTGTNASSYSLSQPLLTADINQKELTISGAVAQNKIFDGTDDAVITGTLTGVVSPDVVGFVGYGNFATSSVGTAIPVTANCSLTGAGAPNYYLTQPTGLSADITPPGLSSQTITFTLNSPVTYGDAPITLNGTASSALPVTYTSSNPSVASISGSTLTLHSDGSVIITASQPGDNVTYSPAPDVTQSLTIDKKTISVLNALGNNKVYDKTTAATFSGTLDGVVGSDNVVLNATGTFPQSTVGTGLAITSTATLSGTDAGKYIFVQPSGLIADITPKELTILNPVAASKLFDGTTTTTMTGTLSGVLSPDNIILVPSAVFTSSAIGNNIPVTSTSTITGALVANYTLTQPTGLTANIYPVPTITEDILPQYIQGVNGTNTNRLPFAYRATISNLIPNATYHYYNAVVNSADAANSNGAGIAIIPNASGFTRISSNSLNTAGGYGTFNSDASGNYTGWFVLDPSANARFTPGTNINMRIMLNDGQGGTTVLSRVTTTNTVKVINLVAAAGPNNGTGLRGNSNATAKNFVLAYDNATGTGRPLSATYVESDGTLATSFAAFYGTNVEGVSGAYGLVIPNDNANGVQRLEQRSLSDGSLVGCATASSGTWPSGAVTVNPAGGTTPVVITITDAGLDNCGVTLNVKAFIQGYYLGSGLLNSVLLNQGVSGALATECDDIIIELHDATSPYALAYSFTGKLLTDGTISCSFPGGAYNNAYYIVVNHRNAIQTWSANPVTMSGLVTYDFSTAANKAYGDNQMEVETGVFALISGDVNQDLTIDGFDYIQMDPDIVFGNSGYLSTDVDGNGSVDAFDYLLVDPNIANGITIQAP
ncbi:MAG: hypothetical protein JNM95_04100 [Chitinophagaceae bacterium]|nr:hypothetical protein [Chitinophagaceae bacterium]